MNKMPNRFALVGHEDFLGNAEMPCMRYEWTLPPQFGEFAIRFLAPSGVSPRKFYAEPIVERVMGRATDYLETACDHGAAVLVRHDKGDAAETVRLHQAYAPLFRNRGVGRIANQYKFNAAVDFAVSDGLNRPELIAPGIDSGDSTKLQPNMTIRSIASRLLQDAIPEQEKPTSDGVIHHYQEMLAFLNWDRLPNFPKQVRLETLPLARTALDAVFLDGVDVTPLASGDIKTPVTALVSPSRLLIAMFRTAKALIHGADLGEDGVEATQHQSRFEHVVSRLNTAARTKDPPGFDRWLKNVSGQGFIRLVKGGHKLPQCERDTMRLWARHVFVTGHLKTDHLWALQN